MAWLFENENTLMTRSAQSPAIEAIDVCAYGSYNTSS